MCQEIQWKINTNTAVIMNNEVLGPFAEHNKEMKGQLKETRK